MFGLRKKGPTRPFAHTDDCKIVKADPNVEIPWQEVDTGLWVAECQCGKEYERETPADQRVRLDPLDPSRFRHGLQCEHRDTTDPATLRAILRVHDRENYWWVLCGSCDCSWQLPHHAGASQ